MGEAEGEGEDISRGSPTRPRSRALSPEKSPAKSRSPSPSRPRSATGKGKGKEEGRDKGNDKGNDKEQGKNKRRGNGEGKSVSFRDDGGVRGDEEGSAVGGTMEGLVGKVVEVGRVGRGTYASCRR